MALLAIVSATEKKRDRPPISVDTKAVDQTVLIGVYLDLELVWQINVI